MPNPSVEMSVQIVSPGSGAALSYPPASEFEVTVTVDAWGLVRGAPPGGGGGGGGGGGSGPPGGGGGIPGGEGGGASGLLGGTQLQGGVEVEAGQVEVKLGDGTFEDATKVASPHLPRRWRFKGTATRTGPGPLVITVRARAPQGFQGPTAAESRTVEIVVDDPRHAAPEMVMELALPVCLEDEVLETLAELVDGEAMPGVGIGRRVLAICGRRSVGNVVSVGVWFDARGFSDGTLNAALEQAGILRSGRTVGLAISAHAIKSVVESEWEATEKKVGRLVLDDEIRVSLANGAITTEVGGKGKPPGPFPDIRFKFTLTEEISLRPAKSEPPLAVGASADLDVNALVPVSVIAGVVSPLLGATVFFAGRYFASRAAKSRAEDLEGVGDALANDWPPDLLHPIDDIPGEFASLFPGKLVFSWNDLTVDEGGVRTLGTYEGAEREPTVSIVGPTAVTGDVLPTTATYAIETRDLRGKKLGITWSRAASGSGNEATATFPSEGRHDVGVMVTDDDELSASTTIEVDVTRTSPGNGQDKR